ncbi:ABC transporter ATP-binding protein [Natribacillus halophilus]|uniref:Putative hemin import ATP-binding protein HrtA n=1 Tax=Natribacillus halophilus TaxID=549003 RepID=A0A1G8QPG4_9BACI|nr:ABC transporter ATP-binding protein [Natribacillus halophilus]SDJ05980.1 putative ABC transport system ATP-binding protein [Natribacillus halophilus]
MTTKLVLENIGVEFGEGEGKTTVLDDVNVSVNAGEFVAITGPSGSGKSTLLSVAGALLTPSRGKLLLDGQVLSQLNPKESTTMRLHQIGFIFQSAHLIPYLRVKDQLLYIAKIAKIPKQKAKKRTDDLLNMLGLNHRKNHYPVNLSGGERQRVAIARAWMNDPELLLADEPTASLDAARGREVVETLALQVKQQQKAAVMVTHDTRLFDVCDRVITLSDGEVTDIEKVQLKDPVHS